METIPIRHLRAGYIVAQAVKSPQGALLCAPGHRLSELSLGRLVRAGVKSVAVEGHRSTRLELDARIEALGERFQGVQDSRLLELKQAVLVCLQQLRSER